MARQTVEELENAVMQVLPPDGTEVEYSEVESILRAGGAAAAVGLLRNMKQQGKIIMRVYIDENMHAHHVISRA